jgi:hypothetical protein
MGVLLDGNQASSTQPPLTAKARSRQDRFQHRPGQRSGRRRRTTREPQKSSGSTTPSSRRYVCVHDPQVHGRWLLAPLTIKVQCKPVAFRADPKGVPITAQGSFNIKRTQDWRYDWSDVSIVHDVIVNKPCYV